MSKSSIFQDQRELMVRSTKALPSELLLKVPEGRRNNIAWNLGHIATVQQQLTYGLSGLPLGVPASYPGLFGKDSSPDNWEKAPDLAEVFSLLRSLGGRFGEDLSAGMFKNFKPYTMSLTGITVSTIEEAVAFNVFHEGIHFGIVLSIMREIGAR